MSRAVIIKLAILLTALNLFSLGVLQITLAAQREHNSTLIQQLIREERLQRCQGITI